MTPDEKNRQALRAAADSLVKRGMLEYPGRGIAKITADGRREVERLERSQ